MLIRLSLIVQAAFLVGQFLNHFSPFDDGCVAPEVNVCRRDVGEALVVAMVIVTDIPQMTPRAVEIVPPFQRQRNGTPCFAEPKPSAEPDTKKRAKAKKPKGKKA